MVEMVMTIRTFNFRTLNGKLYDCITTYSNYEPGLSEYAVEAWERQTVSPYPVQNSIRVWGDNFSFPFTLWCEKDNSGVWRNWID